MFDIALCIVALLLLIFGTEKIITYFYKNPRPDHLQLLFGALLLFVSILILPTPAVADDLHLLWSIYAILAGYSVIIYDIVTRN